MRTRSYLLDSQIVIWMDREPHRIPKRVSQSLNEGASLYMSAVSAWEAAIKSAAGKLQLSTPLSEAARRFGLNELPVTVKHGEFAGFLPPHHRDPFDRLLVAQAALEGLILVTSDQILQDYEVDVLLV